MKEINFEYTADIGFENNLVALLTQEEGFENMRIRIYPPENKKFWDFKLDEFEEIIHRAKERLRELKKIADE